jgi:error-prone DNA polymerase
MICAGFSGGEAEELRRAFGFKRSEARMKEIEVKLRAGMCSNGISAKAQEEIVQSITSFALYGFPESHAASFALIAYASAYLKCHYLTAFTAATLNNQPMGFYQPFTIIKDAQRHGLQVKPIDVMRSDWLCTIEAGVPGFGCHVSDKYQHPTPDTRYPAPDTRHLALRLGLKYVKGLSAASGQAIEQERKKRPFNSIEELHQRVPGLRKDEMRKLGAVGALNFIETDVRQTSVCRDLEKGFAQDQANDKLKFVGQKKHRRDALWQIERVVRPAGPLYEELHEHQDSPLMPMTLPERLNADFRGTGLTIGRHPVAHRRAELDQMGCARAIDLQTMSNGFKVRVAGWVIVRQRPGTAKGFVFLTLEDETGVANIIITPSLFDKNRLVLVDEPFLLIEGILQHQDNVISVKARKVQPLSFTVAASPSHDFH